MEMQWADALKHLRDQGRAHVLVTILGVTGSTPRASGTKMVVSESAQYDSIGGGHLEFQVVNKALKMLTKNDNQQLIEHFKLGPQLGQCCGGTATVLLESFAATEVKILLYGAGHVAKALVPILSTLPCQIRWLDNRQHLFPQQQYANVEMVCTDQPEKEWQSCQDYHYFIVMTHNHQLDYEITRQILNHVEFTYLGLIASTTKWRRFQMRYQHQGIDIERVKRMSCPIGLENVKGKLPTEIAVSIAAEMIACYQNQKSNQTTPDSKKHGITYKNIQSFVNNLESEGNQES